MSCACPLYPWLTGGPTYANHNFSYPDTADEQLSQVDVDKVDQVVEQLQMAMNCVLVIPEDGMSLSRALRELV